jgi:DNA-binding transcriptional MocR family regulator
MARHIVLAPGSIFHVDPEQDVPWSRFNVGLLSDPRFASAMAEVLATSRTHSRG